LVVGLPATTGLKEGGGPQNKRPCQVQICSIHASHSSPQIMSSQIPTYLRIRPGVTEGGVTEGVSLEWH
jgi:hypothetical protein